MFLGIATRAARCGPALILALAAATVPAPVLAESQAAAIPDPGVREEARVRLRTVRLRIFIRLFVCSVGLLVQGTSLCQSHTR